MPVRRQNRIFDHVAHHLAARQVARIHLLPVGQTFARTLLVAFLQRIADTREMVAELAKTQRDVEHRHVPEHGDRPAHTPEQRGMHRKDKQGGHQHGQAPCHPAMVRLARIKIAADRQRPSPQTGMDRVAARQGARLLDQQRKQDGKKAHGSG